jgi:hypothetical protein
MESVYWFTRICVASAILLLLVLAFALLVAPDGRWLETVSLRSDTAPSPGSSSGRLFRNVDDYFSGKCLVSQIGYDGFGHQMNGKLSMIALVGRYPEVFTYVNHRFDGVDHSPKHGHELDEFVGLEGIFAEVEDVQAKFGRVEWLSSNLLDLVPKMLDGSFSCQNGTIYHTDNAWAFTWGNSGALQEMNIFVERSATMYKVRRAYRASAKPPLGFVPARPNVVMHSRLGDAAATRGLPDSYFDEAIAFYRNYFRSRGDINEPLFIIETDDRNWPYIETAKGRHGANNIMLGSDGSADFLTAFHRMVMADGFVASFSSFSIAAAVMRDQNVPMIIPDVSNSKMYYGMRDSFVYIKV